MCVCACVCLCACVSVSVSLCVLSVCICVCASYNPCSKGCGCGWLPFLVLRCRVSASTCRSSALRCRSVAHALQYCRIGADHPVNLEALGTRRGAGWSNTCLEISGAAPRLHVRSVVVIKKLGLHCAVIEIRSQPTIAYEESRDIVAKRCLEINNPSVSVSTPVAPGQSFATSRDCPRTALRPIA